MQIYLITNKVNGKYYIGKTTGTLKDRWKCHKCNAKTRPRVPINFAIALYGAESFTMETISTHKTIEELNQAEIEAIKKWKSNDKRFGYNLTPGGDGAPIGNKFMEGHRHSEESKAKMAASHTGLKYGSMPASQREKISQSKKDYHRRLRETQACTSTVLVGNLPRLHQSSLLSEMVEIETHPDGRINT